MTNQSTSNHLVLWSPVKAPIPWPSPFSLSHRFRIYRNWCSISGAVISSPMASKADILKRRPRHITMTWDGQGPSSSVLMKNNRISFLLYATGYLSYYAHNSITISTSVTMVLQLCPWITMNVVISEKHCWSVSALLHCVSRAREIKICLSYVGPGHPCCPYLCTCLIPGFLQILVVT